MKPKNFRNCHVTKVWDAEIWSEQRLARGLSSFMPTFPTSTLKSPTKGLSKVDSANHLFGRSHVSHVKFLGLGERSHISPCCIFMPRETAPVEFLQLVQLG